MGSFTRIRASRAAAAALATFASAGCGLGGGDNDAPDRPALAAAQAAPVEVGRNVARIPGRSPGDVAAAAVLASHGRERPSGWVLLPGDDWTNVAIAAQFAAAPVGAALLPVERDYIPTGPADAMSRLGARGFPRARGLSTLVLGAAGDDVFADIQAQGLKLTQLRARNATELSEKVVPFRGGWAAAYSGSVVVVSDEARDFALPAAAWSAYSGDTLAFVDRDGVPARTADLLRQRKKLRIEEPSIYVVGPPSVVSERVVSQLRKFGPVKRVGGATPAEAAVALARYRDRATGFGWGMAKRPVTLSLVNPRDWANVIGALNFAGSGPRAPVLLTERSGRLPPPVERYLRQARPGQAFVFGDPRSISSRTLAQVDRLLATAR